MSSSGEVKDACQLLLEGDRLRLKKWNVEKGSAADDVRHEKAYKAGHEALYVALAGSAELLLHNEGGAPPDVIVITPGTSWGVGEGRSHSYRVLEGRFEAIEVVSRLKAAAGAGGSSSGI